MSSETNNTPRWNPAPIPSDRLDQTRVIHKIFEECVEHTSDTYWKDKLSQASKGKFPKGFTYKDGILSYKRKNKPKPINQPISFTAGEAVREFIQFMQSTGKYSDTDMTHMNKQAQLSQIQAVQPETKLWSAVPKKSRRDYVDRFITYVTSAYNLTPVQARSLRDCVQTGIILGAFGTENIRVSGTRIDSIDGIAQDPGTGLFKIDRGLLMSAYASIDKATNKPEMMPYTSIYQPDTLDASKIIESMVKDYDKARATTVKELFTQPSIPSPARLSLIVIED